MSDVMPLDSAMDTGQGADDEPAMAIGDKMADTPAPDPDGDGTLTVREAETLLGLPPSEAENVPTEQKPKGNLE